MAEIILRARERFCLIGRRKYVSFGTAESVSEFTDELSCDRLVMVNKKKLVLATPTPLDQVDGALNWNLCLFCQNGGDLVCPARNPNVSMKNVGYQNLASNLEKLKEYQHLFPCGRTVNELHDGEGILNSLIQHEAKWHKKCVIKYTTRFSTDCLLKVNESVTVPENTQPSSSAPRTRSSSIAINPKEEVCFICCKPPEKNETLHRVMTHEKTESVKYYARKANDTRLLAFLAEGDLVAQEAKYHSACMLRVYMKGVKSNSKDIRDTVVCEGLAFADLILYMNSELEKSDKKCVFNTAALRKLYIDRLRQLIGEENCSAVHEQRFREKILMHFPELEALKSGREYVLKVKNANILNNIDDSHEDLDALAVNRFVRNVRRSVFESNISFSGSFEENCERKAIPSTLLALINMLLYGSACSDHNQATRPALTISQLVVHNMLKSKPEGRIVRHKVTQEPPFPLYVGLNTFATSRNKKQIDEMHECGLSVSSNRIYTVTAQLAGMVVNRAVEEGVVCPAVLKKGIFTVGALDNIDHKLTSTTSEGDFHGTGISLFQLKMKGEQSEPRIFQSNFRDVAGSDSRHVPSLPDSYTEIPEFSLKIAQPLPPTCDPAIGQALLQTAGDYGDIWRGEKDWLVHVHEQLQCVDLDDSNLSVSWAAFHAEREQGCPLDRCVQSLLPLFDEKSTSPAMVKHGMDLIKSTTELLNPSQTPVLCVDQPLFALAKLIQWNCPEYGESKFIIMFGPLHIEQNFLRVLGHIMDGSGWAGVVGNSGILSEGSAQGLLKVSSITKARKFHEMTAVVLHSLLIDGYNADAESDLSFQDWIAAGQSQSPMFKFWLLVLRLETLLMEFVRSLREANYESFRRSIISMLPWLFAVDHVHYARWLTVHCVDLLRLERTCPEIHRRFSIGSFVVRKTLNPFSCIGVDQAHEQNNANVKSRGGAIGLTGDALSLRRWTVAGPEVARLVSDFQQRYSNPEATPRHHEMIPSFQMKFLEKCAALKESFNQAENPFLSTGGELFSLDTRIEISEKGLEDLNSIESYGTDALRKFVDERLVSQKTSFYDSVKKANFHIFVQPKNKVKSQVAQLKNDVQLFSRLFIVSLARSLDLDTFFAHENQQCPPSLSTNGKLRSGAKHEILPILEKLGGEPGDPSRCAGLVFDGAALVRMITPKPGTSTFSDFAEQVETFVVRLAGKFQANKIALVWDQYDANSIKNGTRDSRGLGVRRPDLPRKGTFPLQLRQWNDYLKNSTNKKELFTFMAEHALSMKNLHIVTNVGGVIQASSIETEVTSLHNVSCARMEEADGRLILHVRDMVEHGAQSVLIRCADTDILVLAISFYHSLHDLGLQELWLLFGTSSKKRSIPAHAIAMKLGLLRATALRGFFAFTGCDSVSFFASKGKKSAWSAWKEDDHDLSEAFRDLSIPNPSPPSEQVFQLLEKFVNELYGVRGVTGVNAARKELFATQGKPVGLIPPTSDALRQHTLRAAFQAGQIWGRADKSDWSDFPSPANWGWKLTENGWQPHWSTREDIWKASRDISVCGCASDCSTRRCSCVRSKVPCALACKKCKGACNNRKEDFVLGDVLEDLNEDVDGDLEEI